MVMLRPEQVVFKKDFVDVHVTSLESVPSLYSSNWFSSRLASTAEVYLTGLHLSYQQKGCQIVVFLRLVACVHTC